MKKLRKKVLILLLVFLVIPMFNVFPVHTHDPEEPFTMIIVNDPQFFWYRPTTSHGEGEYYSLLENIFRVQAINRMGRKFDQGREFDLWPELMRLDTKNYSTGVWTNNTMFNRSMCGQQFLRPEGVVINGDMRTIHDGYDDGCKYAKDHELEPYEEFEGTSTEGLFYELYSRNLDSDYDMFPVVGDHDVGEPCNTLKDFVDTLDPEFTGGWEWKNFRADIYRQKYNMQEDWDQEDPWSWLLYKCWKGSFSYSLDIRNYRFIMLGNIHPNFEKVTKSGLYGYDITKSHDWLGKRLDEAEKLNMRVVLCYHGYFDDYNDDKKFNNILSGSNVVAIFRGHVMTGASDQPNGIPIGFCQNVEGIKNAFGLDIPVFQGGHSGCTEYSKDSKFLLAEFADDHIDVAVIDCGEGYPVFFEPWSDWHLRTIGSFNKAPKIEISARFPQGIYEGATEYPFNGNFSDSDPHELWSWVGKVDYGDPFADPYDDVAALEYDFPPDVHDHSHIFDLAYPVHMYKDNDIYTIKVEITDSLGATGTASVNIKVLNADPILSTLRTSEFLPSNFNVSADFTDPGVLDTHTATVAWGDGNVSKVDPVEDNGSGSVTSTHKYNAPGSYTVNVTVTDKDGGMASQETQIIVQQINEAPAASFTYSPLNPQVNDTITFDASGCSDADGTIVSYLWDFGDGDTSTTLNPTHAYDQEGSYIVTLTVTDNDGLTDTATKTISDLIPEFPSFIILPLFMIATLLAVIIYRRKHTIKH